MKRQLTRISILQSSKIITALYAILGLVYSLIGVPMILLGGDELRIIGVIYLIMPVFMAIFGFIGFVIFAALYNLMAGVLGGIEYEVTEVSALPEL